MNLTEKQAVAEALIAWYHLHARRLPWRPPPGSLGAPYPVWISEIMLQQTTVATVIPYFLRFLEKWSDVHSLADSSLEQLLQMWQGLGYYSRAQNMHRTAQIVSGLYGGVFPKTHSELLQLPGIGPYTAAAISAFAFGAPETVVDGNVKRVIARLFGLLQPLSEIGPQIETLAKSLTPPHNAADYGQAIMDLGATICTPKSPACHQCPLQTFCSAYHLGLQSSIPTPKPKAQKPKRWSVVLWVEAAGHVVLRQRPATGLLAHMMEFPTPVWEETTFPPQAERRALAEALYADLLDTPVFPPLSPQKKLVTHVFTHLHLTLEVWRVSLPRPLPLKEGKWVEITKLSEEALPTLMRKVETISR